jgi:hypothetical protein
MTRRLSTRHFAAFVFIVLLAGCMQQPAPMPSAPQGVKQIVVPKPVNRTQSQLVVDDPGWLDKVLSDDKKKTVADVLASHLRDELERRGFRVAASDPTHALPMLKTEIRGWEPYSADWSLVVVDLVASLEDPQGGRTVWTVERTDWRIPTRDARSSREASIAAATTIAETLVAGWEPAGKRPIDADDEAN